MAGAPRTPYRVIQRGTGRNFYGYSVSESQIDGLLESGQGIRFVRAVLSLVDEAYLVAVHHIHTFGERHADTALAVVNQTSRHVVDADLGIGSGNNL